MGKRGNEDGLRVKALTVVRGLAPYGRRHWRVFAAGAVAAAFVVAARLALPWPLRAITDLWVADEGGAVSSSAVAAWHPALRMGTVFLGLLVALGLADLCERLYFARFSIAVVRDLRADTFHSVARAHPRDRSSKSGDLVARLIGDTARIKSGLKTFLVHVVTNGIVFLGVIVVLLSLDPALGLVFGGAALGTAIVTVWAASRTFRTSLKYRKKEGRLADTIQQGLRHGPTGAQFDKVNHSSGTHEAALTRFQGIATWTTYSVFGLSVLAALWVGVDAVEAGRLAPGDMVVFMMYAVMMRGPIVRLARQGSQTGKVLGAGYRVVEARHHAEAIVGGQRLQLPPLRERLRLEEAVVAGSRSRSSRPRLGPIDVEIPVGQRVLVTGGPGAGKSTLLELLAGKRNPAQGRVLWDGIDLATVSGWSLAEHVSFVQPDTKWPRKPLSELLAGVAGPEAAAEHLADCGLGELLARLPAGIDTPLGTKDVSPGERQLLGLAGGFRTSATLWLLDDPTAGLTDVVAGDVLRRLLHGADKETIVVAMSRPMWVNVL